MTKQKDAVYNAVVSVKGADFATPVELSKEERAQVSAQLAQGFRDGTIAYQGEVPTEKELSSYVSGLVSNWVRKDKRLNGGVQYVPSNPGTRTGAGDETLKAMKQLLALTTEAEARAEIETAIAARIKELKPKKALNIEALPESLRHFAQQ
jgi:hypothetical protein